LVTGRLAPGPPARRGRGKTHTFFVFFWIFFVNNHPVYKRKAVIQYHVKDGEHTLWLQDNTESNLKKCYDQKNIHIPDSVISIEHFAFSDWKAGVHTPELAPGFFMVKTLKKYIFPEKSQSLKILLIRSEGFIPKSPPTRGSFRAL
jgi:hypothetical protein